MQVSSAIKICAGTPGSGIELRIDARLSLEMKSASRSLLANVITICPRQPLPSMRHPYPLSSRRPRALHFRSTRHRVTVGTSEAPANGIGKKEGMKADRATAYICAFLVVWISTCSPGSAQDARDCVEPFDPSSPNANDQARGDVVDCSGRPIRPPTKPTAPSTHSAAPIASPDKDREGYDPFSGRRQDIGQPVNPQGRSFRELRPN